MNKNKATMCLIIAIIFLVSFIGNTAVSRGTYQLTWYFDEYNQFEAWTTNPEFMVDGDLNNFSSTSTDADIENLISSTYDPSHQTGTIIKVEIRARGKYSGGQQGTIILRPIIRETDGSNYYFTPNSTADWSQWFDITSDNPNPWAWQDIDSLDCDVEADIDPEPPTCTL